MYARTHTRAYKRSRTLHAPHPPPHSPILISWGRRQNVSPKRLLLPLSYACGLVLHCQFCVCVCVNVHWIPRALQRLTHIRTSV